MTTDDHVSYALIQSFQLEAAMEPQVDGTDQSSHRPLIQIPMKKKDALCAAFSYDSKWLAAAGNSGKIEIYRVSDGGFAYLLDRKGHQRWPCTSMSFRPPSSSFTSRNVLLTCDIGGQIHHWHATSGKHLSTMKEADNQLNTIDIQPSGDKFATAGSDFKVRIYDEGTRRLVQTLSDGNGKTSAGHSNRVFAVRWHVTDANVVLSGGWDSTVQVWDLRVGYSVRSIFGPSLCGEALDISQNNTVLTGSWRNQDQLQEWDYGSGELIKTLKWMTNEPSQIYTAQYGKGMAEKYVVGGGSKPNGACLFHRTSGQALAGFSGLERAVYAASLSECGEVLAVTTAENVYLYDMVELSTSIFT